MAKKTSWHANLRCIWQPTIFDVAKLRAKWQYRVSRAPSLYPKLFDPKLCKFISSLFEWTRTGNLLSILIHDQWICQQTFMNVIKNPCMGLVFIIVVVPESLKNEQFSSTLLLFSTNQRRPTQIMRRSKYSFASYIWWKIKILPTVKLLNVLYVLFESTYYKYIKTQKSFWTICKDE